MAYHFAACSRFVMKSANTSTTTMAGEAPYSKGLSADELQLRAQGHKGELPRQFSAFSTLALAFSMPNSWVGCSATFIFPLYVGGGPTVFFGLIAALQGWQNLLRRFLQAVANITLLSWHYQERPVHPLPSTAVVYARNCVDLASFYWEYFVATQWQTYLIFVLIISLIAIIAIGLPNAMPIGEGVFFLASLMGFFVFFITVLETSKVKQPSEVVFTKFANTTGWSDGMAFMLGVGSCMYAFLATDRATHIAEARLKTPRTFRLRANIEIGAAKPLPSYSRTTI
ncbi:hypothetical protein BDZ45DRAFT_749624 [Acephala macrosclerotiorum]|nr:hypothetical protein BDZ45DRAFT_749624 [Acephala macrosclerotiorum]